MSEKRRLDLDVLRGWLCTAVLLVHVFGQVIPNYAYVGMENVEDYAFSTVLAMLNKVVNLTVPGFIFLSGYFVLRGRAPFDSRRFLKSRLRSTLPLYVGFSLLYYLRYYRAEGLRGILVHLIAGTACYQLYFVPIVVQLYLLTPILAISVRRWPRLSLCCAALLSLGFCVANTLFYPLLAGYHWCVPYLIYYVWGMVAGLSSETVFSMKQNALLLAAYLLLAVSTGVLEHWAAYRAIFVGPKPWNSFLISLLEYSKNILGLLWLRQVCQRFADRLEPSSRGAKAFSWAASQSYLVYLAHPILLGLLSRYIARDTWRLFFIFPPLVWALTWVYSRILEALRAAQERRRTQLPM